MGRRRRNPIAGLWLFWWAGLSYFRGGRGSVHPRRWVVLASLLSAFLAVSASHVAVAQGFYSASVAVADRTEGALSGAASMALAKVLTRVSGDEEVAALPAAAAAIKDARNRLSLYTYQDVDGDLMLLAQFDSGVVKTILRQAGATFWSESRPPVLLWLVVDEPFSRRFATVSEDSLLIKELSSRFADRGVSLRLPLLDLEDAAALSPEMVWQKVVPRIEAASERYGTEHILVGRYVQLTSGRQIVDWMYLNKEVQRGLQLQGDEAAALLAGAVDLAVDAMAEQFAVKLEPVSAFDRVNVAISGVETFGDYRSVMRIIEDISVVDGLQVAAVEGDLLVLKVSGVGSADALARLLPQASRLVVSDQPLERSLNLRWGQP